jgi:hypothetical protein
MDENIFPKNIIVYFKVEIVLSKFEKRAISVKTNFARATKKNVYVVCGEQMQADDL